MVKIWKKCATVLCLSSCWQRPGMTDLYKNILHRGRLVKKLAVCILFTLSRSELEWTLDYCKCETISFLGKDLKNLCICVNVRVCAYTYIYYFRLVKKGLQ